VYRIRHDPRAESWTIRNEPVLTDGEAARPGGLSSSATLLQERFAGYGFAGFSSPPTLSRETFCRL